MKHEPVKSSMIRSIGYDPETKKMEVKFTNNSTYTHENIEQDDFDDFLNAPSIGKHYNENFRR